MTENKKVTEVKVTVDEVEANESWKESVKSLKAHIHRKRVPADCLNSAKESLENDEILMQVDYGESYKNAEQDEIQSAYFGHTCFSLFTACIYYRDKQELLKIPITVTTESSEHSRIASFPCLHVIMKRVVEEKLRTQVKKVVVWSDGGASQFRSRYVFHLLSTFYEFEWHYNEAHHGKGPMDGIGGTVKNIVFKEVKSGRLSIKTPRQFVEAADKLVAIDCLYLHQKMVY